MAKNASWEPRAYAEQSNAVAYAEQHAERDKEGNLTYCVLRFTHATFDEEVFISATSESVAKNYFLTLRGWEVENPLAQRGKPIKLTVADISAIQSMRALDSATRQTLLAMGRLPQGLVRYVENCDLPLPTVTKKGNEHDRV